MIQLYSYFRSSASFRVRIALNLKELAYETVEIHLVNNGGEQKSAEYAAINPQKLVPTLTDKVDDDSLSDDSLSIGQSVAMMEYLEEQYPQSPLLPSNTLDRAKVRSMVQLLATDVHPLDNLRVLQYLTTTLEVTQEQKMAWYFHWIDEGFTALERLIEDYANATQMEVSFCFGDTVTMADCCLIPQVYNAQRFEMDLSPYPFINQIYDNCMQLPAFKEAYPVDPNA